MKALTKQEEQFAQLVAGGECSKSDAVRKVYNCTKLTDKRVNEKASEIARRAHVKARIEELQALVKEQAAAEFAITAETKLRWLADIAADSMQVKYKEIEEQDEEGETKVRLVPMGMRAPTAAISAINEINKMDGGHAAQKLDVNANITQAERVKALKAKLSGNGD